MKKKTHIIILICMVVLLLAVAGTLFFLLYQEKQNTSVEKKQLNEAGLQTYADMTDVEEFQTIPFYNGEGTKSSEPEDRGDNVFMVTVNGTNKEQYIEYLQTLTDSGFTFFADNGEEGIDDAVYTASFTKDKTAVTVTYIVNEETAYITSSNKMVFSEHLIYKEEYKNSAIEGMKNTLYMYELYNFGNSFVVQLKNGHFIVNDGGQSQDMVYLLDYMEELAPNGEKPVVEAWFVTHAHGDHLGALSSLATNTALIDRLYIDGIYMSMPSNEAFVAVNSAASRAAMMVINSLPSMSQASDGSRTKVYRPQTGQRLYFCDIVVDIMHTQEQLVTEDYANLDLNDSSLWTMYHMDGQKFLLCGDADRGSMNVVMKNYSQEYLDLDVYVSFHHNLNNWIPFLEYIDFDTVLFSSSTTEPQNKAAGEINGAGANAYMKEHAKDYYSWEDGGKKLIFPYEPGTAEKLPMQEWEHHASRDRTDFMTQ